MSQKYCACEKNQLVFCPCLTIFNNDKKENNEKCPNILHLIDMTTANSPITPIFTKKNIDAPACF